METRRVKTFEVSPINETVTSALVKVFDPKVPLPNTWAVDAAIGGTAPFSRHAKSRIEE